MRRFLLLILLLSATTFSLVAQKVAHVNFGNLLNDLPTVTAADQELKTFNDQLTAQGKKMVEKFRADVAAADQQVQDLTPKALQALRSKLEKDQRAITEFEREILQKVDAKRREKLEPIIRDARAVIERVAKANGYQIVVDSSIFNFVLYGGDAVDISSLVRKEMGL